MRIEDVELGQVVRLTEQRLRGIEAHPPASSMSVERARSLRLGEVVVAIDSHLHVVQFAHDPISWLVELFEPMPEQSARRMRRKLIDRLGFERVELGDDRQSVIAYAIPPPPGSFARAIASVPRQTLFAIDHYEDEGWTVVYRERPEVAPRVLLPDVDDLARAIFDNDAEVLDFLMRVADHKRGDHAKSERCSSERWQRAKQIAWDRDEQGWRSAAFEKASQIYGSLHRQQSK